MQNRLKLMAVLAILDFTDVNFTDVKFDSGLGKLYMDGIILGNSEFECGIGSISLKIKGKRQDYAFKN